MKIPFLVKWLGAVSLFLFFASAIYSYNENAKYFKPDPIFYQTPQEMLPIIHSLGVQDSVVAKIKIQMDSNASTCNGGHVNAAACFIAPNTIVFPKNLLKEPIEAQRSAFGHEYLHYVWNNMSRAEKDALKPHISQVYNSNKGYLDSRFEGYVDLSDVKYNELHSYIGTELDDSKIPQPLLDHYKKYIPDRSALPNWN